MRALVMVVAVGAAACNFSPHAGSSTGSDGSNGSDGPVGLDAPEPIDAPPAPDAPRPDAEAGLDGGDFCIGPPGWAICLAAAPSGTTNLSGTLDTDTDAACANPTPSSWTDHQDDACVVVDGTVAIIGNLTVKGHRPLVLAGAAEAVMNQDLTLDVSGHEATNNHAPGAPFAQCVTPVSKPGKDTNHGSGGGAGGTFMTPGGNGGEGNNTANTPGGVAGQPDAAPIKLRAGCDGQKGADGSDNSASGGNGGGGLYIASPIISFQNVVIDASGGGAPGGGHNSGGSGGGAGGMVVLFASTTMQVGGMKIVANGGGGSSGADNNGSGRPGSDPAATSPATPAAGGGTGAGAIGGNGYAGGTAAQNGANGASSKAGGGGGGGGGYIVANQTLTNVMTSPAVTVLTTFPVP